MSLFITACDQKEEISTGSLEIVFKGTFGNEPLYMFGRSYDYRGDAAVKWQLFQFFLSDLELLGSGNAVKPHMLSAIESVSFGDIQSEEEALEGYALRFNDIETGTYSGLQFGLGVAPELNATQPSDYTPSEPLAQVSSYWEAASSYIYTKIEGNADLDNDGQFGEDEEKLTYHLGASELFQKRTLPVTIDIRENSTTSIVVNVDLLKALENTAEGTFIDFRQTPRDHHKNPDVYNFVITQLRESAISIGN
ncbi:hypothetical protein CRP01_14955 [Flavilitoribacter nigricans DSM 23189 = NBRC 102662]|uniref:Copper-binding protein MbnP-like domain-containing protein n=1 Tax=Flavilitoribacter nigricans (strain ATCC 23147 / DSM 23189 / NBRC 102662 / NCIMB 1420 / SS-2) TaxID=1122177 RepID=A0A2D0NB84_FLAN2|nr:hypothetical protein CRP01_14955 [Flavilitoribacter nigricans DSM 23189 = NBRC 102662]